MATSSKYEFDKYTLSDHDVSVLAYVAMREQGTIKGAKAELSLMANRFEDQSTYSTIVDYVLKSGWFAAASTGGTTNDAAYTKAVRDVLCKGNRTLPPTINEHDCINPPDINRAVNGNNDIPTTDRSKYKQGITHLYNIYGGSYYFWCFPDTGADPFGYTNKEKHEKWIKQFGVKGELYYKSSTFTEDAVNSGTDEGSGLIASPQKLYTSNNYQYIKAKEEAVNKTATQLDKVKNLVENIISEMDSTSSSIANLAADIITTKLIKPATVTNTNPKTIVSGSVETSTLPVISIAVEAPYFEVEIGSVKFGGYHNNNIPNYVKSLQVIKTNGSINEYTIQLIHQIRPGDNPNYIDEILSKNGYDTISIRYGNANTGTIFSDSRALITDISENFDFISCNITYTISATSVASTTGGIRRNFPAFAGKASDEIRRLLWEDKSSDLATIFKGMVDKLEVEKEGLIPTNDSNIEIGAQTNITTLGYLALLVARMENSSTKQNELSNSSYSFVIMDSAKGNKFKIKEITSNINEVPFMYEVNIGYLDDNFVLGFNVNTNFSWAVAYESSKKIKRYDYELDTLGNLKTRNIPAYYKNTEDVIGSRMLWTSLTRYPIEASLTVRGLLQDSLLMQYIKVNQYMYGAKRITSGVYIVTEQSDSIGNGVYTTNLKLMRISGDEEYVNVDGRIIT